jgi:F0F1-type ATP synthase delta subunit
MNDETEFEDDLNDDLELEGQALGDDSDEGQEETEVVKPTSMTPEQIADLAAQAAMRVQPRQQQQRDLSPEELDQRLNRYKVSPDIVKLLRDPEAAPEDVVSALQALVDGAAKHAVTSSQLLFQNDLSPLQQQMQAQQAYVAEQQTRTFVKHVGTQYPGLAGKDAVVRQAIQAVNQSGYRPKSKSDAQKQVALVARDIIRAIDPSFSLKANPARQAGAFAPRRSSSGGGQAPAGATGARSFADYLR